MDRLVVMINIYYLIFVEIRQGSSLFGRDSRDVFPRAWVVPIWALAKVRTAPPLTMHAAGVIWRAIRMLVLLLARSTLILRLFLYYSDLQGGLICTGVETGHSSCRDGGGWSETSGADVERGVDRVGVLADGLQAGLQRAASHCCPDLRGKLALPQGGDCPFRTALLQGLVTLAQMVHELLA